MERERSEWQRTSRFNAGQVREARDECDLLRQQLHREREERGRASSASPLRPPRYEAPIPIVGEDCPPLMRSTSPQCSVNSIASSSVRYAILYPVCWLSSSIRSPDRLDSENLSKSRECDELRMALAQAQDESQEMFRVLESIRERVERLTAENSVLRLHAKHHASELHNALPPIEVLRDRPNINPESPPLEHVKQLEGLQSINAELTESLREREETLHDREATLALQLGKIRGLEKQLLEQSATIDELQTTNDDLSARLREGEQKLQAQEESAADWQRAMDDLSRQASDKDQELHQQRKTLETSLRTVDELRELLRERERKLNDLRELVEEMRRANKELRDHLNGMESLQRSHDELRKQLMEREMELYEQRVAAEALQTMNDDLRVLLQGKEQMLIEQMDSLEELQVTNRTLLNQCKMFEQLHRLPQNLPLEQTTHSAGQLFI